MITYTYCCPSCGVEFDARQRMSESPLTNCATPGCTGTPRRVIQPSSFVLKGKGWFRDGY